MDVKRKSRSYKCVDSAYKRARAKAKREGTTLAEIIEMYVINYSKTEDFSDSGSPFLLKSKNKPT
jgi:hypothetical protein